MLTLQVFLLFISGLFMGVIGVTSGGGAMVGVPLLMLLGHSASTSIINVKLGLLGSFLVGASTYRKLGKSSVALPRHIWPLSIIGSILGANLVLKIDPDLLRLIVFFLLLVVLILTFILRPKKLSGNVVHSNRKKILGSVVIFLLCIYSGFFGAGFGSFLIFALVYFYGYSFLESAAFGTKISLFVIGSSTLTFWLKGAINFHIGVPLMIGCAIGGFVGAKLAYYTGDKFIRITFISVTLLLLMKLGCEIL